MMFVERDSVLDDQPLFDCKPADVAKFLAFLLGRTGVHGYAEIS